jgi:alkylhydroperoxidase/carboxymuconolactone decarboxylase family protein YurZ
MKEVPENVPPFLAAMYKGDRKLYDIVMNDMGACMPEEGAIPKKYRLLMSMIADGVLFHPHGATAMAGAAREAGATEDEINEAMRIIYLSGGMVALVNSLGAYQE